MNKSIKVGLFDWDKFPLNNDFYPDDLPAEWKLSFYANEFETVCINFDELVKEPSLDEWFDDLAESFDLCLSLSSAEQFEQLTRLVQQSELKLNCLLIDEQERDILLQNKPDISVLLAAGMIRPEQIVSRSSLWTPDINVKSAGIALLPDIDNIRLYREWIELWLQDNSHQQLKLWMDGSTARYATLSKLRTLVELMGY